MQTAKEYDKHLSAAQRAYLRRTYPSVALLTSATRLRAGIRQVLKYWIDRLAYPYVRTPSPLLQYGVCLTRVCRTPASVPSLIAIPERIHSLPSRSGDGYTPCTGIELSYLSMSIAWDIGLSLTHARSITGMCKCWLCFRRYLPTYEVPPAPSMGHCARRR